MGIATFGLGLGLGVVGGIVADQLGYDSLGTFLGGMIGLVPGVILGALIDRRQARQESDEAT